jgi:hypothetical protein
MEVFPKPGTTVRW